MQGARVSWSEAFFFVGRSNANGAQHSRWAFFNSPWLNYENYQCGIYKECGLATSISTGDTAGDSFCRALQRRQIVFDQHACRAQKISQDEQYSGADAVDQFFYD